MGSRVSYYVLLEIEVQTFCGDILSIIGPYLLYTFVTPSLLYVNQPYAVWVYHRFVLSLYCGISPNMYLLLTIFYTSQGCPTCLCNPRPPAAIPASDRTQLCGELTCDLDCVRGRVQDENGKCNYWVCCNLKSLRASQFLSIVYPATIAECLTFGITGICGRFLIMK